MKISFYKVEIAMQSACSKAGIIIFSPSIIQFCRGEHSDALPHFKKRAFYSIMIMEQKKIAIIKLSCITCETDFFISFVIQRYDICCTRVTNILT